MVFLDWIVVALYFGGMAGIGIWAMRRIKGQEDFFMGGRGFGKLLQTFAAFGAGTGSSDPVNTGRTTFTGGLSGMWSVMYWLFVTPLYWFAGVWFRRMRHLTTGDWFVERYESRKLGAAYAVFGVFLFILYIAMLFSAIGKFAAPLFNANTLTIAGNQVGLEYVLVPVIAVIIVIYGVLGGLTAAYWTDLIQGLCIIVLSALLIPFGLTALVERFGDPDTQGMMSGFAILHEQLPAKYFTLFGSDNASEFPLYRIVAVVIINMIGIVIFPHFIATGGGTAKTEMNARVGLVTGNLLKRFCTVGWALTALIGLALYSHLPELANDPDRLWGVASRELLAPGLLGLMLACLLAALMSSVDCYMLVSAALVVRNIYVEFINPEASEAQCLKVGRITSAVIVLGSIVVSWMMMDVFKQLQLTWIVPILFAAPFWLGLFWRRATCGGAWGTIVFCGIFFFLLPWVGKVTPGLNENAFLTRSTNIVTTESSREAAPSDVRQREAAIAVWEANPEGETPEPLVLGERFTEVRKSGGKPIFWSGAVTPLEKSALVTVSETEADGRTITVQSYDGPLQASGNFKPDFLVYAALGMDLESKSDAMLDALGLPVKIVLPFLVMFILSLLTKPGTPEALDRYYAKMRTEVSPDPEEDRRRLEAAYANPADTMEQKLWPDSNIEIARPTKTDVVGFLLTCTACFVVIGLVLLMAGIGT
jgi:SSS family solute:Na+ symporter